MDPEQSQHSNNQFSNKVLNMTMKGTLNAQKLKKRQGLFGIFGGKVSIRYLQIYVI